MEGKQLMSSFIAHFQTAFDFKDSNPVGFLVSRQEEWPEVGTTTHYAATKIAVSDKLADLYPGASYIVYTAAQPRDVLVFARNAGTNAGEHHYARDHAQVFSEEGRLLFAECAVAQETSQENTEDPGEQVEDSDYEESETVKSMSATFLQTRLTLKPARTLYHAPAPVTIQTSTRGEVELSAASTFFQRRKLATEIHQERNSRAKAARSDGQSPQRLEGLGVCARLQRQPRRGIGDE
jgi:hypothetical protein